MRIRDAGRNFNIPERTLHRRLISKDFDKRQLGTIFCLGLELETKLALHVERLQAAGFAPSRKLLKNWHLT
jgi:hypothetical protein